MKCRLYLTLLIFFILPLDSFAQKQSLQTTPKDNKTALEENSELIVKKRKRRVKRKRRKVKRDNDTSRYSGLKRSKVFKIFGERIRYKSIKWFTYFNTSYSPSKPSKLNDKFSYEADLFSTGTTNSTVSKFNKSYTFTLGGGILINFASVSLDSSVELSYLISNKTELNVTYIDSMPVSDKEIFTRTSDINAIYLSFREALRWRDIFFRKFDLFGGFSVGYCPNASLNHDFVVNDTNSAAVDFKSVKMKFSASTMVTEFFVGAYYEPIRSWFASLQLGVRTLEFRPTASETVNSAQFSYVKGEPMKDLTGHSVPVNLSSTTIKLGIKKEF